MNTSARGSVSVVIMLTMGLCLGTQGAGYADPPEGRGNGNQGNGNGQQHRQDPPGQSKREEKQAAAQERKQAASERAEAARETAANNPDRLHPHQARGPEDTARGERRGGPAEHPHQVRDEVGRLTSNLRALERARWSYHPHDPRPQGNAGNVTMRDPYGFDKDSGREGADRGRPIREPEAEEPPAEEPPAEEPPAEPPPPTLSELVSLTVTDGYEARLLETIAWWQATMDPSSPYYAWYSSWAPSIIESYEAELQAYHDSQMLQSVLVYGDPVNFSLAVAGMEGSTFQVTTQLVNTATSTQTGYTGDWQYFATTYEAGQVLVEQTQEVTLAADGTFNFTIDPSMEMLGGGYFASYDGLTADILVTVTDTSTGESYTFTYDQQIYLVDPYGIVYDRVTGQPIANAVVTIHEADGSVVVLDKSGNPNATNPQSTDATGRYSCRLPAGKYYLTVEAPGYESYKSRSFSERGTIVREDVAMTPVRTQPAGLPSLPLAQPAPMAPGI